MNSRNLEIVLVGTSHPGNIGAAARAMKTMGLNALTLVEPQHFPHPQATANAGHAADVLETARVCGDLDEALAPARLVFGLSARSRRYAVPAMHPSEAAAQAIAASQHHAVALVFGRERTGLTSEEVGRCHALVRIPANPDYPSLNLAAAVQVVCYELRLGDVGAGETAAPTAPASAAHLEDFYRHLAALVAASGYAVGDEQRVLMQRLRGLFNRARPAAAEVNLLRGWMAALERRLGGD